MQTKCTSNLKQINLALNLYLNSYNQTYPCADDPNPKGLWLWMGRGWRPLVAPYLQDSVDANTPSVLWCQSDQISKKDYDSTSYAYSMSFYHSPEQINQMTSISDTYGPISVPSVAQKSSAVKHLSQKIIVGEWLSNHMKTEKDSGWWCWQGKRNYLFADGQVNFIKAEDIRPANDGWPNPNLTIDGINGIDWP